MFLVRSRRAHCNELVIGGDESSWKAWQEGVSGTEADPASKLIRTYARHGEVLEVRVFVEGTDH